MIEKASAIITNHRHELLVVQKRKNSSHYILPGGKLDSCETPVEALIREVREELNVEVSDFRLLDTVVEKSQFEDFDLKMYLFETEISGIPEPSGEIEAVEWIDIFSQDFPPNLATGISKHAIPYLLANVYGDRDE